MYFIEMWAMAIIEIRTNKTWAVRLTEIQDWNYANVIDILNKQQRTGVRRVWTR